MALHSKFVSGILRFFSGATNILDIDPAGFVDVKPAGGLKLAGTAVTVTAAQLNAVVAATGIANAVAGVAASYKVARGETALDGSNPTPVATGLASVIAFVAMLKGTAAPGVGTAVLTSNIAGAAGNVDVYSWKPTSNADPTLLASTGTESFYWVAIGT